MNEAKEELLEIIDKLIMTEEYGEHWWLPEKDELEAMRHCVSICPDKEFAKDGEYYRMDGKEDENE